MNAERIKTAHIHLFSFGFKYHPDQPPECDMRIDVRNNIRNPQEHLPAGVTGQDKIVIRTILKSSGNQKYIQQLVQRIKKAAEAASQDEFVVGIGCHSGIHRSVVVAEAVAEQLRSRGYQVTVEHRHLQQPS